jgi:hypothetical protein
VGFLPLARLIIDGLSMMDSTALMTLVDWCYPETHMFHLSCGETMVTLQDVAMILCLPINGSPFCGTVTLGGWRDFIEIIIGLRPPNVPADQKDKKTMGIHSRWLTSHFDTCPEGAEDVVI